MDETTISREALFANLKRVVLKLGSSVVTAEEGLDRQNIRSLVDDVCRLKQAGKEIVIVSSGAIAAGVKRMELKGGAKTIPQKQAAAAVGQTGLMAAYEEAFWSHGVRVGQLLLSKDDLSHRRRYLNARNTLMTLLSWGVVPIINENDTVMVEEIQFGDNDNLSALVASVAEADLLLILTDMEGLMDCDPRTNPSACLITLVEGITPEIRSLAGSSTSAVGRGGMASKLEAASKAGAAGVPVVIARGKIPSVVDRIIAGEMIGTLILPGKERISARKRWIRYHLEPEGALVVDAGAARAVKLSGKSLLPIGVTAVRGLFQHGAAVTIETEHGQTIAIGLSNYASDEMEKIKGHQTAEIDWVLGFRRNDEAVHADNLVLLDNGENSR